MLLSIDGRVCLEGLMIFGIGGLFFIYIIAPKMDDLLTRFSSKSKIIVCVFYLLYFSEILYTCLLLLTWASE
ncbi:putative ABC transporter permease [[Clostridium] hylemonae]|uniref:putative ABC transporter permease n=1 Tax=[Clostridium] hylemonae TaxID=89153 RepID=UPI00242A984D|nr:hypothetical protein [[Clostridium] hylemonae]